MFVLVVFALMTMVGSGYSQTKKSYSKTYGYFELAPIGGVLIPIGQLSEQHHMSGKGGLNLGYRINKEVSVFLEGQFNALSNKVENTGESKHFISITAGPRYYFTNPKLKSALFFETGAGAYIFPQENLPGSTAENSSTRFGVNAGVGADIFLAEQVGLMIKTKYTNILGGSSVSFIGVDAGVNIHFK